MPLWSWNKTDQAELNQLTTELQKLTKARLIERVGELSADKDKLCLEIADLLAEKDQEIAQLLAQITNLKIATNSPHSYQYLKIALLIITVIAVSYWLLKKA